MSSETTKHYRGGSQEFTFNVSDSSINNPLCDKNEENCTSDDTQSCDTIEDNISSGGIDIDIDFQLHPQRWLVLASYCLLTLVCGSNWLCFPAVSNILREYYNISILSINMLTIVFGIAIVIFSVPFAVLLEKYGLSVVMKISALLNLAGAVIKYFGDDPDYGYWLLFVGNSFHALSVSSFLFLPGHIATTWFGGSEHGKATSLCCAFDALGTGLGFLVAASFITNNPDPSIVRQSIKHFLMIQMIPSILVFVFVVVFVRRRPTQPPNLKELVLRHGQLLQKHKKLQYILNHQGPSTTSVSVNGGDVEIAGGKVFHHRRHTCIWKVVHYNVLMQSLKTLLKNKDFQLILHIQGVVASVEGLFEILLNEMLIEVFPGHERMIGILGFISVICGFLTNIIAGTLLDKTGRYRFLTFIIFLTSTGLAICWYITFEYLHSFILVSIIQSLLMSVVTSYYTVAFAHSEQVAGNASASSVGVMLVLTSQVYDTVCSFAGTKMLASLGSKYVNGFVVALCVAATIGTFFVRNRKPVVAV